jgi:hypothetical protein
MNWINVKDKLPEKTMDIIIWVTANESWYEATFSTETNSYIVDLEFGMFFNLEEVSHWMVPTKPE